MKITKLILLTTVLLLGISVIGCTIFKRTPAQSSCEPKNTTNQGTHFEDYERCRDL